MSVSGLHSLIEICASGISVGGVTYLVSRGCSVEKYALMMFEIFLCCVSV